jgi:hypothetical protein
VKQNLDHVANEDLFGEAVARLSQSKTAGAGDWVDAYRDGEALSSDQAGAVANVSPDTIRRRCGEAADIGEALGIFVGGVWLVSLRRLLADIERRKGRPELAAAEARAKKMLDSRDLQSSSENLLPRLHADPPGRASQPK